jgi:hypothetical protein
VNFDIILCQSISDFLSNSNTIVAKLKCVSVRSFEKVNHTTVFTNITHGDH